MLRGDLGGYPPKGKEGFEEGLAWFLERLEDLKVKDQAPQPLVLGRHLMDRGFKPGPYFKVILDACFEAQLDGDFTDLEGGLRFLDDYLKENNPDTSS